MAASVAFFKSSKSTSAKDTLDTSTWCFFVKNPPNIFTLALPEMCWNKPLYNLCTINNWTRIKIQVSPSNKKVSSFHEFSILKAMYLFMQNLITSEEKLCVYNVHVIARDSTYLKTTCHYTNLIYIICTPETGNQTTIVI